MQVKVAAALAFAVSASAVQVQYPAQGSELDLTKENTIKWTSVSTDPSSLNIYLVNNAVYPPVSKLIASNVETSKGSYTLDGVDVPANKGYQINLQSDSAQNTGILAQSGQFDVVSAGSPTTSASFTATTATDVTSTSTTTGSSTTLTTTSSSASSSSSASASASSSGASSSLASSTASSSAHASGANASSTSTPNAAGTLSVSTGASSLLLGLFALFM